MRFRRPEGRAAFGLSSGNFGMQYSDYLLALIIGVEQYTDVLKIMSQADLRGKT